MAARSDRPRGEWFARACAVVFAVAANLTMFWVLARVRPDVGNDVEPSLQVTWLLPEKKPGALPLGNGSAPRAPHIKPYQQRHKAVLQLSIGAVPGVLKETPVADGHLDDQWSPVAEADSQTLSNFERNPLKSTSRILDAPPERLKLTFTDRSIGGRLQQMTKASICGDLRKALVTSYGSEASIMESMRRYGCI